MEITFRVALFTIFLAFIFHRAYYTRKIKIRPGETIAEQDSKTSASSLMGFVGLVSIILYVLKPESMAWSSIPLPGWLRWSGVLLAVLGYGLLQWSHSVLGQNWSDTPRITKDQELVTGGPYRWIRHPIYTAFLLILGSTLLISANWFIGGLWIVMTSHDIVNRIRYEEEKMAERFGEAYIDYSKRTGRILPKF